jgi:predicted Zn-ribbon and HTH transcriptional regulator
MPEIVFKSYSVVQRIGDEWCVLSEKGKRLGCFKTRKEAQDRLREIEYFKHQKEDSDSEFAKQECYCEACGSYFFSSKRCDLSRCPVCGEQDDLVEITGV